MVDKPIRIILDSKGARRNADELNQSVKGIGSSAEKSQFSVNRLAAAIATVISVQKITQFADSFTRVQNQLTRTVSSTDELAEATQKLLDVANKTRSGIEPTVELYTALTVSTKDLSISQDQLVGVTKTINNLFLESGKGANETAGAIRQLGQALESGALRGDEFNSVAEGAPGILRAVQQQTGLTRAELRQLAEQGKITAELLVTSLQNYSESAQKAADKTKVTLSQALTVANNNFTALVGRVDKALGITTALSQAIIDLSNNFLSASAIEGFLERIAPSSTALAAMSKELKTFGQQLDELEPKLLRGGQRAKVTEEQQAQINEIKKLIAIYGEEGVQTDILTEKVRLLAEQKDRVNRGRGGAEAKRRALDEIQLEIDKYNALLSVQKEIEKTQPKPAKEEVRGSPVIREAKGFDPLAELEAALEIENANIRVVNSAENVTKSLENELALRRTISDIYRSNELSADASLYEQQLAQIKIREAEELAIAEAKAKEEAAQREERLAATLENDRLTDDTRKALEAEFNEQKKTSAAILEEELNAIKEKGKNARMELDKAERENAISAALSLGESLMILTQNQNKRAFQLSKKAAVASAGIAGVKSAIEAWRSGMETSGPWAPFVAAAYTAASLAKTSSLINKIKSVNYGGGGGGGGGGGSTSIPSLGGGGPSIPSTASTQQVEQRRIYELRGAVGSDKITVDQFKELMEKDGAVVVLSDSVNDARRRNVVGVTAR